MESETCTVVISELSDASNTEINGWDVEVTAKNGSSICQLSRSVVSPSDREEIRWYLEDFASNNGSPFETLRAARCSKQLRLIAHQLHSQLGLGSVEIPDHTSLELHIVSRSTESDFFSFPWEILEDVTLFRTAANVTVIRRFQKLGDARLQEVYLDQMNILVVTARPDLGSDIEYLLITRRIMEVVARLKTPKIPIYVEIARPGTWSALVSCLEKRRTEGLRFNMVHMDVHGLVVHQGRHKGSYLTFLNQAGDGPHNKKAGDVAKVLVHHGIRVAIMNACKSTSSTQSNGVVEHGIAQVLIRNGIDVVLGMSYDISQGAAEKFVGHFYRELLAKNRSLSASASSSRAFLSKERKRKARFGLVVEVDDWIVPCLYVRNLLRFKRSQNATPLPREERWAGITASLSRASEFVSEILPSIKHVRQRFQTLFANENDHLDVLIGRDMDIYALENIFLLPLLQNSNQERLPSLHRRIVHVNGWAGIGKTALLQHLMTWWKATHLVEDSIYCHFQKLEHMNDVQGEIKSVLSHTSEKKISNIGLEGITRTLQAKRYLLVLDHLDAISVNVQLDFLQQLARFLGTLATGQSFVVTASRNREEGWLGLSRGLVWRLSLDGLPPQAAVQLIKLKSGLDETSLPQIESRKETEAMLTLVDWCERTPAALIWAGNYIKETKILPSALLRMSRTGKVSPTMLQISDRFQKQIDDFFAELTAGVARADANLIFQLTLIMGLAAFRKRIPADFELSYLFMNWKGTEGTPMDYQTLFGAPIFIKLTTASNSELMKDNFVQEFLKHNVRDQLQKVLKLLRQKSLIWWETCTLEAGTGATETYLHIHPLLTFCLQNYLAHWTALADAGDTFFSFFRSPYLGFATYYDKRVFDFDDSNSLNANISRDKMLLELENITTTLEIWLSMRESSYLPSWILSRIGQSFNLATLSKEQFRNVLDTLDQVVAHFQDIVTRPIGVSELQNSRSFQVHSFLQAAEVLQNMYFATEEWSLVRHYTSIIDEVLNLNEEVVESSDWVKAQRAQTRMVKGYEHFARGAHKEAKKIFEANLAYGEPQDIRPATRTGYKKLRFMNSLGLWKCRLEDPDYHLKSMQKDVKSIQAKIAEWCSAAASIDTGHGWDEHSQYLINHMVLWESMVDRLVRSSEDGEEGEGINLHDLNSFLQETSQNFPMRQNASKTMYSSFAKANVFQVPQNITSALLTGLTNAYRDQIDDVGVSSYLQQLIVALIKSDNFETALQTHERWTQLRRTRREEADKHIERADEYILAVCYNGVGDFETAQKHCSNALQLSSIIKADKVRLACLHIAAILELRKGNFKISIQHLCEAGVLAYTEEVNAQYQKKGSIMQMIYAVGCFAMSIIEDEDIVSTEKQPILISSVDRLQFPTTDSDANQGRERKRPSEILRELFSAAGEKVGVLKMLTFLAELANSPTTFVIDENSISWERLELHLFGNSQDLVTPGSDPSSSGHEVASNAQSTSTRFLEPDLTRLNSVQRAEPSQVERAITSEGNLQTYSMRSEEPNPWNAIASSIIRLVSALRDASQRSFLWHICGGAKCDLSFLGVLGLQPEALPVGILDTETPKQLVKLALEYGANPSLFDNEGRTPLMRVVEASNFEIADLLLQHGAEPDHQSFVDETALQEAVKRQDVPQVEYCLSNGFSSNIRNLNGMTALGVAVTLDSAQICWALLHSGANPLARDYIGRSCLRLALEFKQYDNFRACLGTLTTMPRNELVDFLFDYGYTNKNVNEILAEAQGFPNDIVELLKDITTLPDDFMRSDKAGVTWFHRGTWMYTQEAVYMLFLQCGADPSIQEDCFGLTVLHMATLNEKAMAMYNLITSEGDEARNLKDRIMNHEALEMVLWKGSKVTLSGENFSREFSLPERRAFLDKYFLAWARKCRERYVHPLSAAEVESIAEFRCRAAFSNSEELEENSRAATFLRAAMDNAYASMADRNPETGEIFASQAAARLFRVEKLLCEIAADDASEDLLEERWTMPWALNPLRMPHVFYLDRHGVCHYTEPLYRREDPEYRVWVVDGDGVVKGVLGAVDA